MATNPTHKRIFKRIPIAVCQLKGAEKRITDKKNPVKTMEVLMACCALLKRIIQIYCNEELLPYYQKHINSQSADCNAAEKPTETLAPVGDDNFEKEVKRFHKFIKQIEENEGGNEKK